MNARQTTWLVACGLLLFLAWCSIGGLREPTLDHRAESNAPSPAATEPQVVDPNVDAARTDADADRAEIRVEPLTISGRVSLRGRPMPARRVQLLDIASDRTSHTTTDDDGRFRFDAPRGDYVLGALKNLRTKHSRFGEVEFENWNPSVQRRVELRESPREVDLELPPGRIEIVVRDATTRAPIRNAWVNSNITHGWSARQEPSDAQGRVVFEEIGTGDYSIHATANLYRTSILQSVTVTDATPIRFVEIDLEPAGDLAIRLVDAERKTVEISAAMRLRVQRVGSDLFELQTNAHGFLAGSRPSEAVYGSLLPGIYRVSAVDEVERDAIRFQPIELLASIEARVDAGERSRVDAPVRYRCYARLIGENADGEFDPELVATVTALDGAHTGSRVLPAPWQTGTYHNGAHFEGYVLPGAYEVTFTAADGRAATFTTNVHGQVFEREFRVD